MGSDALRYFLLREVVFGHDGSFSYDALVGRYNSDLANGLGNLASRTLTMIRQYRDGVIPAGQSTDIAAETIARVLAAYEKFEFSKALEEVWSLISTVDKYIVQQAPWKQVKNAPPERLDETLYTAAEAVRIVTALLAPGPSAILRKNLVSARHADSALLRPPRFAAVGRPPARSADR